MSEQVVLRPDRGIAVREVDPGPCCLGAWCLGPWCLYCHDSILTIIGIPNSKPGNLASMSGADEVALSDQPRDQTGADDSGGLSGFGVASVALAALAVVAVALIALMWSGHRAAEGERRDQARAMQAAAEWTGLLINMNADNVEASMARLRDGTVGELNSGFEASIAPYRDVVRTLRSSTTGQVESVSIEMLHADLSADPGARPGPRPDPSADSSAELSALSSRTDTVLVVATSVSENSGGTPTTVRWNLRLGVSEVDGKAMISGLESLR